MIIILSTFIDQYTLNKILLRYEEILLFTTGVVRYFPCIFNRYSLESGTGSNQKTESVTILFIMFVMEVTVLYGSLLIKEFHVMTDLDFVTIPSLWGLILFPLLCIKL